MRYLLLMVLTTALVCGGCDDDSDSVKCNLEEYIGDFAIETPHYDIAILAGYTSISGSLHIHCPACTDTDLSDLSCLASVGGSLDIAYTDDLTNLDGLSNLSSVGEWLIIEQNAALANLGGLSGITSVGEVLFIEGNYALTNLDGLSALTSVGGNLCITINTALTNLDGLSALNSVGGDLQIAGNDILPDCEACELLGQLTSEPTQTSVISNLDDTCTPVPASCP